MALATVVLAAVAVLAPVAAPAVTHPETTRMERPATAVDRVRLRVTDKIEANRVEMTVPVGITVPLPDTLHSIRVTGYTEDFALTRMPAAEDRDRESGPEEGNKADPDRQDADPVPREKGRSNPAVRVRILRDGEPVGESWVFARAPYLFQPPNLRYTFALLGAPGSKEKGPGKSETRP